MTKNLLLLTCATGALGLMAGVGHAATAAADAADTSQSATNVTEIVVTAEKREQSLQKVPVAVSVFTGAQRDVIGINSVQDVTNFAPGFTYDPGNVHAYIRGVGRQSVNVTDDQRVANYEDEFYVYSPYGLDKSSLFLSQEQIERGPQNVGGRNAAAGSIDMISVRPTDEPYAEVRASVGNFGANAFEAAVSGQVAPGLDMRIAGFDKNQDHESYYRNVAGLGPDEGNVIHEWYVEGQLDWKPNDRFEFWARTFFEGWNGRGDAGSRTGYQNGSWRSNQPDRPERLRRRRPVREPELRLLGRRRRQSRVSACSPRSDRGGQPASTRWCPASRADQSGHPQQPRGRGFEHVRLADPALRCR